MADSADLLAAIAAAPADDLPRLVYADWLEERGDGDYAQFIRDQIRLSHVPEWDPLAIRSRHQLRDTLTLGRPFRSWLPELPAFMKWSADQPFHRGFGCRVVVTQLSGLLEAGPELFDRAPIDELWLGAATLDQWRAFAKSPWLKNVRKLHLHFSQGLYEPIRCLAESKYSGNIEEIWFDTLATPAAGTVIEAIAESKLSEQLAGLHMRLVHVPSVPEIIDALSSRPFGKLERLSMVQAGLDIGEYQSFCNIPARSRIQQLNLSGNYINALYINKILQWKQLNVLELIDNYEFSRNFDENPIRANRRSHANPQLQKLEKRRNFALKSLTFSKSCRSEYCDYLSAFSNVLKQCHCFIFEDYGLQYDGLLDLATSDIWPTLREINLAGNSFSDESIEELCRREIPSEFVAVSFTRSCLSDDSANRLHAHFGDALVWAAEEAATGLAR